MVDVLLYQKFTWCAFKISCTSCTIRSSLNLIFRKPNGYNHNIYLHIYILDQFSLMIRIEPIESEPITSEPIRSEQT